MDEATILAFDHAAILDVALKQVVRDLGWGRPGVLRLLPNEFNRSHLECLVQSVITDERLRGAYPLEYILKAWVRRGEIEQIEADGTTYRVTGEDLFGPS